MIDLTMGLIKALLNFVINAAAAAVGFILLMLAVGGFIYLITSIIF